MSHADRIRQFVFDQHIMPARSTGLTNVTVRSGDIHKQMGLRNAMPAVCSALGGGKFLSMAAVSLHRRAGPANGSNVYFTYNLKPKMELASRNVRVKPPGARRARSSCNSLDFDNSLVLVSCVKSKLSRTAPARDLYTSQWFSLARARVETANADWFVLSALYGLVDPNEKIEPYEQTLTNSSVVERQKWAANVLGELSLIAKSYRQVVILAGEKYREFLVGPLRDLGLQVSIPMEGLRFGEQLRWLGSGLASIPTRPRAERIRQTVVVTEVNSDDRMDHIDRFYRLLAKLTDRLGGLRVLANISEYSDWPRRGVYFIFEPEEFRANSSKELRVVRVGTHGLTSGSKSTLIQRLRQHRGSESGGGNHRGSIFRLLIGQALLAEMSSQKCRSWGVEGDKGKASKALNVDRKTIDASELPVEMAVSQKICNMPFICLGVDDEPGKGSLRSILERNSIALLSNFDGQCIDLPSDSWLGHRSDRELVRKSGLWNQRHVNEAYDSGFLDVIESLIT